MLTPTDQFSRTTTNLSRSQSRDAKGPELNPGPFAVLRSSLRRRLPSYEPQRPPRRIDLTADDRIGDVEASEVSIAIFYFQRIRRARPAAARQAKGCSSDARHLDVQQPFTARVRRRRSRDDPGRNRSERIVVKEGSVVLVINRMRHKRKWPDIQCKRRQIGTGTLEQRNIDAVDQIVARVAARWISKSVVRNGKRQIHLI